MPRRDVTYHRPVALRKPIAKVGSVKVPKWVRTEMDIEKNEGKVSHAAQTRRVLVGYALRLRNARMPHARRKVVKGEIL